MKITVVKLSPSRPLIGADLDVCFRHGLIVLLAGELIPRHVDWYSRLSTTRGKLLRNHADSNSFLIFGPESPTTNPYNPSATPDILDIVITRDLHFPIDLNSCSALTSDHLPVLIDTRCRPSFHCLPDRLDARLTDWANFQATWKPKFRSTRKCSTVWTSTRVLGASPALSSRLWRLPHPNFANILTQPPKSLLVFRKKYA